MSLGPIQMNTSPALVFPLAINPVDQAMNDFFNIVSGSAPNKQEALEKFYHDLPRRFSKEEKLTFINLILQRFQHDNDILDSIFAFIISINSEQDRFEILQAVPVYRLRIAGFSKVIHSLSSEKQMELMKLFVQSNYQEFLKSAHQFKFEDPNSAMEIVKLIVADLKGRSEPWSSYVFVLQNLHRFKIEDTNPLYDFVISEMLGAAEKRRKVEEAMPYAMEYWFKTRSKDGQKSQEAIEYIFKMIVSNQSSNTRDVMLSAFIDCFFQTIKKLTPVDQFQKMQIEFAFECMAISPKQLMLKLPRFKIPCEQTRLKLFEAGRPVTEADIIEFRLSKETLLSIYKTLDPEMLITTMGQLDFTLEEQREIKAWLLESLIAMESDAWVRRLTFFNIVDPNKLLELAFLATKHLAFGAYVYNFNIESEENRIKLFEKFAEKQGYKAWSKFDRFNINDNKYVAQTIVRAIERDPKITLENICEFGGFDYRLCGDQFINIMRMAVNEERVPVEFYRLCSKDIIHLEDTLFSYNREELDKLLTNHPCPILKDYKSRFKDIGIRVWVLYFLKICDLLKLSHEERGEYKPYLDYVMKVKEPNLRKAMLRCLLLQIIDSKDTKMPPKRVDQFEMLAKAFHDTTSKKIVPEFFNMMVSRFPVIEPGKDFDNAVKTLKRQEIKADGVKQRVIAKTLGLLIAAPKVDDKRKWALFEMIFAQKDLKKVIESCRSLTGIFQFENYEILNKVNTPEELKEALIQLFVETTKVEVRDNLKELFFKNIFTERSGLGLCLVRAAIEKARDLTADQRKRVNDSFKEMTEVLLYAKQRDEAFRAHRFKQTSAHINAVFGNNEALKKEWANGAKEVKEYKAENSNGLPAKNRIEGMEKNLADTNHYPASTAAMNTAILKCIKDKSTNELSALKLDWNVERLAKLFINLADPNLNTEQAAKLIGDQWTSLNEVLGKEYQQHIKDLEDILKLSTVKSFKGGRFTFEDTDNPEDLLLCGTEVQGSCLATDGINARCVFANMVDFKIRMAVAKDENGRIIARRAIKMLRLKSGEAVVLRERLYKATGVPDEIIKDLDAFIGKRANDLGCTLGAVELNGARGLRTIDVESLDSVVPLEYSDAAANIGGTYPINSLYVIQEAPKKEHQKEGD